MTAKRLVLLLGVLIATGISLFYLWVSWQSVYWLNERQAAEIHLQALENERERLRFEVAQAFSLKRIERLATSQPLYMIVPTSESGSLKYLEITSNDSED